MIYTHLIEFETDDFISRIATTREEKLSLIESGFDYMSFDPDALNTLGNESDLKMQNVTATVRLTVCLVLKRWFPS